MNPKISVIIPTYNREPWLSKAIDSVLAQSYSNYELIVVDDASTDKTPQLLEGYSDSIQKYCLEVNQGVSAARNRGIVESKGKWVAFLDSDDQWLPQKLEAQMNHAKQHPEMKVFFTDEIWIRHGVRVNPMKKHQKQDGWIFQPSLSLCLMAPSTVLIHRSVFEDVGVFDETLSVCEDYDLWLRIMAKYPVALLNEKLMTRYGGHDDQLSSRSWGNDRYRVQSLHKILKQVDLKPEDQQALVQKLVEKCEILIKGYQKRENHKEVQFYQSLIDEAKQQVLI